MTSSELEAVSNSLTDSRHHDDPNDDPARSTSDAGVRAQKLKRLAVSFAIAVGVVLVFVGISVSVTGRAAQKLPAEIQRIHPVRSATQVLSQEQIVVDLGDGYTGVLIVNNVEIETFTLGEDIAPPAAPGAQVTLPLATIFEQGNNTLTFTPTEGAPVEEFSTGVNTVQVRYWKLVDGPSRAKSFTWQFDVV